MTDCAEPDMFVFILGAGFSRPFGLPVMSEFMESVREGRDKLREAEDQALKEHYQKVELLFDEYQRSKSPMERDWENMEELYTQAHLLELTYPAKGRQLCESLEWVIWHVYSRFNDGLRDKLGGVLDHLTDKRGLLPAFVTTNYDLLIEWGWWTCQQDVHIRYRLYYPGMQYWQSASPNHILRRLDPAGGILRDEQLVLPARNKEAWQVPVVKLHGSTSWFRLDLTAPCGGHICEWVGLSKFFGERVLEAPSQIRLSLKQIGEHLSQEFPDHLRHRPAIIPPMLGKVAIAPLIRDQWRAAILCLQRARYVAVIGYSFPSSDLFVVRLLTESLKTNDRLQRIWIVDLQGKPKARRDWEDRVASHFTEQTFRDGRIILDPTGTEQFLGRLVDDELEW